MDCEDIPLFRHLPLLLGVLKGALLLAGLLLFPLMVLVRACGFLLAERGAARWFYGWQTIAWACAADAYCLPVLAMILNLSGYPAIAEGRGWPCLLGLISDRQGADLMVGEILLQAGLSCMTFVLSWCAGSELDDGQFVPRPYLLRK